MHLHPRRRNVAAQVAEELKTVTYATRPPLWRNAEEEEHVKHSHVCAKFPDDNFNSFRLESLVRDTHAQTHRHRHRHRLRAIYLKFFQSKTLKTKLGGGGGGGLFVSLLNV